jgi:hypothetical protein
VQPDGQLEQLFSDQLSHVAAHGARTAWVQTH